MFTIEKNVPITANGPGRPAKYPFGEMGVGDSFLVTGSDKEITNARIAAYGYGGRTGKKFSSSVADGALRVWRVS